MTETAFLSAKYDYRCPLCCKHTLSEYRKTIHMDNIVIFGGGVAALSAAYHIVKENHPVTVVMMDEKFNVNTEGARFLHVHDSVAFNDLLKECDTEIREVELGGGVTLCDEVVKYYSWSDLIADQELSEQVTRSYAKGSGRTWSPTILNNLQGMTEAPRGLISPSYVDLISYMESEVDKSGLCTYRNILVDSISLAEQSIRLREGPNIEYDLLINTVPFWAFKDLLEVHLPIRERFKYTEPRYCIVEKIDSPEFSMTYYAGESINGLTGAPIKRVSCIDGQKIIEFFERPTNYKKEQLVKLPPNIEDVPKEGWQDVTQHLHNHNVELLGRFAQMKSKMMFTDIIDASFELVQSIWREA